MKHNEYWWSSGEESSGGDPLLYSLRLNTDSYLRINQSTGWISRDTFTVSYWYRENTYNGIHYLWSITPTDGASVAAAANVAYVSQFQNAAANYSVGSAYATYSTGEMLDNNGWYHVHLTFNNTEGMRMWINGLEQPPGGPPTAGQEMTSVPNQFGINCNVYNNTSSGRVIYHDFHYVDNQNLPVTDFIKILPTGTCVPKIYDKSHGPCGFWLDFNPETAGGVLGNVAKNDQGNIDSRWDMLGVNVDFTVHQENENDNGWSYWDLLTDTPNNRYPVLNMDYQTSFAWNGDPQYIREGGLQFWGGAAYNNLLTPIRMQWGKKYYFEMQRANSNANPAYHVCCRRQSGTYGWLALSTNGNLYAPTPFGTTGTGTPVSTPVTSGVLNSDTIGWTINLEANPPWIRVHNGETGTEYTITDITQSPWNITKEEVESLPWFVGGGYQYGVGENFNFGQKPFQFKPSDVDETYDMGSNNTPIPRINPQDYFRAVAYTGPEPAGDVTVDLGIEADMLWFKNVESDQSSVILDTTRNNFKWSLAANEGWQEYYGGNATVTGTQLLITPVNWGNRPGETNACWAFKAGGRTFVNNTEPAGNAPTLGSIMVDDVASTNAVAGTIPIIRQSIGTKTGLSITYYTGNGTSGATVQHGLTGVPDVIIIKRTDPTDDNDTSWVLHYKYWDWDQFIRWNQTNAIETDATLFNNTATTNLVTLGDSDMTNASGGTYVMYCFQSVPGYSMFQEVYNAGTPYSSTQVTDFVPKMIMHRDLAASKDIYMYTHAPEYEVPERRTNQHVMGWTWNNKLALQDFRATAMYNFRATAVSLKSATAAVVTANIKQLVMSWGSAPGGGKNPPSNAFNN